MKHALSLWLLLAGLLFCLPASAEQKQVYDGYEVHYAAMLTADLDSEVARIYNIPRSGKRAFIMVNVRQLKEDGTSDSVSAQIEGTVSNLVGQVRKMKWQEITEQEAIYSLSHFPITNRERTRFQLKIRPAGSDKTLPLEFRQQFYTD